MRIVFMGTPEEAIPSLEAIAKKHDLVGVVTTPDRPQGRGLKVYPSPVKAWALSHGYPLHQPERLDDPMFVQALRDLEAHCFVVVAFRILPPVLFRIPPLGTVNLHFSLLPKYRGAAPVAWALMNGESETGVTTFLIEEQVDTGDILLQARVPIHLHDDAGSLTERLSRIGAELLLETLEGLEAGTIQPKKQEGEATPAPKIRPAHGLIHWSHPAEVIARQIRALSPKPGAYTTWRGKRVKLFTPRPSDTSGLWEPPGTVVGVDSEGIQIQTGSGVLSVREIQLEGRRRMSVAEFLRGYPLLKPGERFE